MKRAKITYLAMMLAFVASVAFVSSCTKEADAPSNDKKNKSMTTGNCEVTYQLLAGQTINAGTLIVSNDATNLYVTYNAIDGATFNTLHLWVGKSLASLPLNQGGNPVIGQFPYQYNTNGASTYTFTIPLADIPGSVTCEDALYIVAHAEWCGTTNETAFGGNVVVTGKGRWWRYAYHQLCCDDTPNNPVCYRGETAWAEGSPYVTKGNWATYTEYTGTAKSVTLFAGQTMNAGTVSFSAVSGGMVDITVTLNTGWRFDPYDYENIKIEGYQLPPSGNPSPGLFTYKFNASGTTATVSVPQWAYYGVHVSVQRIVPCNN